MIDPFGKMEWGDNEEQRIYRDEASYLMDRTKGNKLDRTMEYHNCVLDEAVYRSRYGCLVRLRVYLKGGLYDKVREEMKYAAGFLGLKDVDAITNFVEVVDALNGKESSLVRNKFDDMLEDRIKKIDAAIKRTIKRQNQLLSKK